MKTVQLAAPAVPPTTEDHRANRLYSHPDLALMDNDTGFVPAAARLARPVTEEQLSYLPRLQEAEHRLRTVLRKTLPLETSVRKSLQARIGPVQREVKRLEHAHEYDLPTLDPKFLAWKRNEDWLPVFSIYDLNSDTCRITYHHRSRSGWWQPAGTSAQNAEPIQMTPQLPEIMKRHYLNPEMTAALMGTCESESLSKIEIAARYDGAMPHWVRERIHAYMDPRPGSPRFEKIFIIAEAPQWQVNKTAAIPVGDPLVVGVAHDNLWLIAAYDLTSAEAHAKAVFSGVEKIPLN